MEGATKARHDLKTLDSLEKIGKAKGCQGWI
jgi:hypothetical protein